jgi:ligand-binding sensor domain-containing protein/signal transduction histidine kinase
MLSTRIRVCGFIFAILLFPTCASAVGAGDGFAQFAHHTWTLRDGHFVDRPQALTQTADGYLWVGTPAGLYRFDGVRFQQWQPPRGTTLPNRNILTLLGARDGSLWIGTPNGLARWKDGSLVTVFADHVITAIHQDEDATLWIGTHGGINGVGKICALRNARPICEGDDGALGRFVISIAHDAAGRLWVGAATGLWQWTPARQAYAVPHRFPEVHDIADGTRGPIVAVNRSLRHLVDGVLAPLPLSPDLSSVAATQLLRDRSKALWVGTPDRGLFMIRDGEALTFTQADGLSSDFVVSVFEDREGSIWVATRNGVDQLTALPVATLSAKQGLSAGTVTSVVADGAGAVWIGTVRGLNRWAEGRIVAVGEPELREASVASLLRDSHGRVWVTTAAGVGYLSGTRWIRVPEIGEGFFRALAEDREGNVWVSEQEHGLYRITDGRLAERLPWSRFPSVGARALAADPRGGVWVGLLEGGVGYVRNSRLERVYTTRDGLGAGAVWDLQFDQRGALWVATDGGLSRIDEGRIITATPSNGLPCAGVQWVVEDNAGALWARLECGLVRIARLELDAWSADRRHQLALVLLDTADGVVPAAGSGGYAPNAAKATDGRIWFRSYEGVGVIDPTRVRLNAVIPPVHIERVTVDRQIYPGSAPSSLAPSVQTLSVQYTALSLIAPNKVQYRYQLEGRDSEWVDADGRREAFYNDLEPGRYRFRVIASNNAGVWNTEGATWAFVIQPAFYQTAAFRIATGLSALIVVWALYKLRIRHVARLMDLRFEERLAERNRIAQGLHDTLLQGLVSVSMQLYAVREQNPPQPVRARLDHVLQRIGEVMEEGRRTLNAVRAEPLDDLEAALASDIERFRGSLAIGVKFLVRGERQPLHPVIRDAVYQISREAVVNAVQHSKAHLVEISVDYGRDFLVQVSDDGIGIDTVVLEQGRRAGHWGLPGMKEKAERIGATLRLRSRPAAGTEVQLSVPGAVAFLRHDRRRDASLPQWLGPADGRWIERALERLRSAIRFRERKGHAAGEPRQQVPGRTVDAESRE